MRRNGLSEKFQMKCGSNKKKYSRQINAKITLRGFKLIIRNGALIDGVFFFFLSSQRNSILIQMHTRVMCIICIRVFRNAAILPRLPLLNGLKRIDNKRSNKRLISCFPRR